MRHTVEVKGVEWMIYGRKPLVVGFVLAVLAGLGLHGLYDLWPNGVTALLAPVNESLWEHIKILFWPYLMLSLALNRGRPTAIRPWLATLLGMCGLMLLIGYGYHVLLGLDGLWFDLGLYGGLMALGFWVPNHFSGPYQGLRWRLPILLAFALGIAIIVFTVVPPNGMLFADLSGASAWSQIPC